MSIHKKIEKELRDLWCPGEGTPSLPKVLGALEKVVPKDAVVLDFSRGYSPDTVLTHLRDGCTDGCSAIRQLADQIEAQTKPPRVPEPRLYSTIVAGPPEQRVHWVRGRQGWTNVDASGPYLNWTPWDELEDPESV